MAKCKNCKNLYNLSDEDDVIIGKWCPKINDSPHLDIERDCEHYAPMTNADRIRSMTDEELAMAIMCPAEFTGSDKVCDFSHDCKDCTLAWLQKESEGGHD